MKKKESFKNAVAKLRKDKESIYKRMEAQASDPETARYYSNPLNNLGNIDIDILGETI